MFERMLDHPNIKVLLNTALQEISGDISHDHLVYTGPIDEFFEFRYGPLPYRSLRFEHRTEAQEWVQAVGTINYPNQHPYTRVTEMKHLTGQHHAHTTTIAEYPTAEGDPYYPIPRPENRELYERYSDLADATPNVTFVGRLATYRYYNMDQVVAQALKTAERLLTAMTSRRAEPTRTNGNGLVAVPMVDQSVEPARA
jgi:UDP-galactopyranose mutase